MLKHIRRVIILLCKYNIYIYMIREFMSILFIGFEDSSKDSVYQNCNNMITENQFLERHNNVELPTDVAPFNTAYTDE